MTNEEKQLLLKDLCARLPYWPNIKTPDDDDAYIVGLDDTERGLFYVHVLEDGDSYDTAISVENFKPYLRPMSSMIEEEFINLTTATELQYNQLELVEWDNNCKTLEFYLSEIPHYYIIKVFDWLNAHHFDYRGLIEKGLALEAPVDMYKID